MKEDAAMLATLDVDGWELEDGAQRHREHPKTFWVPAAPRRYLLRRGRLVKLMFRIGLRDDAGVETENVERMWVIVTRRLRFGLYEGVLDNDASCTSAMRCGLRVVFEPRHVIQIGDTASEDYLAQA